MRLAGRSVGAVLLPPVVAVALGACTPAEMAPDGPYAEEIQAAQESTDSDFQREVLADGVVTREEYDEAMQRYADCVSENGAAVTLEEQTGYYVYRIDGDPAAYDAAEAVCSPQTKSEIEPLFVNILMNPAKRDDEEMLAECMVQSGIVKAPFTTDDLAALEQRAGITSTAVSSGDTQGTDAEDAPIDPEAERIITSPEADTCRANPNYYALVAAGELAGE